MTITKPLRLLTWFDVQRVINRKTNYRSQLPEAIVRLTCFSDALEVGIRNDKDQEQASQVLKSWFGDWYQPENSAIQLDIGNATLPVEFYRGEEASKIEISIRPFWEEISYLESSEEGENKKLRNIDFPQPYPDKPDVVAFYSFKGGVGRTLNLAAHIFALLEQAKLLKKDINILVIDADLEAPGLTYWNADERQQPTVSFIDFLESYHYPSVSVEETLNFFAKELKKSARNEGMSTLYFLPAFIDEKQLLDTPILPENLARSLDNHWQCGDAIYELGCAVDADYILIDLRAGLSEISSPIIFDPRIQRFLVTTINEQSVRGISLVLKQMSYIAPSEDRVKYEEIQGENPPYYDPSLIISMLTPELKSLPAYDDALVKLQSSYVQSEADDIYSTRLNIKDTYFAQELLYINNWEEAREKLNPTSIMQIAREWAKEQLIDSNSQLPQKVSNKEPEGLEAVRRLKDICIKYIYAESGEGEDLLVTEPLRNLAMNFRENLPLVVSLGAKGAGKTFNYIQLSRLQYWEKFLQRIENQEQEVEAEINIFPLLQSTNLKEKAKEIINQARNNVRLALGNSDSEFSHSECVDRIKKAISSQNWSEPEWAEFWINEIAKAIGIRENISNSLSSINQYLKEKSVRIILLFDGLEDIFSNINSNEQEQIALKSLIENLPNKLSEIRQSNLGLIIFLRRDFLRYTITQNAQQFEHLYRAYDLRWDRDSFLRLVFWLCIQSEIIVAEKINFDNIDNISAEDLKEYLEKLWGKKLGTDKSKEANSAFWIFAALTDFYGRLQARDIVRFLYHAANITIENSQEVQFEKWSKSRVLPPQSIRRALKPCSEEKVTEAKQEYPQFKQWVETKLFEYTPTDKKIPFAVENLDIDPSTIAILEQMGVIYEDKEKEDPERFYIPEIFREGLGFSAKVARPRVIALKRKVLGKF